MFYSIITTIQDPTDSVRSLVARISACGGKLVVAGDSKGPSQFDGPIGQPWPVEFLSLDDQCASGFSLAKNLPIKHYARKNIAYLHAIAAGATCIYETDDDNAPNMAWEPRNEYISDARVLMGAPPRWINVYRYFTDANIWPRGLPLNEIRSDVPHTSEVKGRLRAPIQQGLVDGSPDVDAIWRLVLDQDFHFEANESVYLEPGNWCPFNTQTTWWWPIAYPLLYVPSYCSFRMCDIWKSFIAQRCLWAMGTGLAFHAPEVQQERNPHDLSKDFSDEISGYENNRRIAEILGDLDLAPGEDAVAFNLRACYEALVREGIFPQDELILVDAWISDLSIDVKIK